MDRNDEWQRLIDEYRDVPVPEYVRDRMQDAIARGKKRAAKRRRKAYISAAASGAAAVILILVLLPNLNAQMADRMGKAPVFGGFFRAVTFREYSGGNMENSVDENGAPMVLDAESGGGTLAQNDVAYDHADTTAYSGGASAEPADGTDPAWPESPGAVVLQENADNGGIAMYSEETEMGKQTVSDDDGYTEQLVERFHEENERNGGHLELTGYEVVTNSDEWFTMIIYANENVGTEYSELRRYYNVDKTLDRVVTLSELYNGRDYVTIISDEILSQMEAAKARAAVEDVVASQEVTESVFTQINENQNYYFNEDGDLVIVLDESQTNADLYADFEYVIDPELLE